MGVRERYFEVAEELIARNGFNGASMRDFAKAANTSLSNLYNHFASKAELLKALLESANQELMDMLLASLAEHDAVHQQLEALTEAYVEFVATRQKAALIALSEFRYLEGDLREHQVANRDRTESIFADVIARGVASGDFRTPYPEHATRAVITMLAHIASWYRPDGPLAYPELAKIQGRYVLALVESTSLGQP